MAVYIAMNSHSQDLQTIKFRKHTIQVSTKTLAFKNKIIVSICGKSIVDVVVRETGARADIKFVFTDAKKGIQSKSFKGIKPI